MTKKILVIGELNLDLIVSGLTRFPALGHEIVSSHLARRLGSSSAICAAGLARLGAEVAFLGKVGNDPEGEFVVDQLEALHVATDLILREPHSTTGVTISLAFPEDRALITYPGCIAELKLEDIDRGILPGYRHLHVGSYFLQKQLRPGLPALFATAHRCGLTISLDPGSDPEEEWGGSELLTLLDQVDVFLPNEREATAIAETEDREPALRRLAQHATEVIVKCGVSGAVAMAEDRVLSSPGLRVQAVDPTGAGDSFDAGYIYARILRDLSLEQALLFANACGALATTQLGGTAAQPTEEVVAQFLLEHSPVPDSVLLQNHQTGAYLEVERATFKPTNDPWNPTV